MNPTPYLFFDGTCEEAMRLYSEIFNGKDLQVMHWSDMPDGDMPPDLQKKVMHASVTLDSGPLYASDYMDAPEEVASPSLCLNFTDVDRAREVFDALSEGAKITFPLGPNFFSPGYADITDRFGTRWMLVTMPEQA